MYQAKDYLYNGLLFMNNILRPRHKKLSQLMIYATTRCQSRCKHCSIWKKPEEHLSLEDVKNVVRSKCVTGNTTIGLEGGEFLLHPEADAIMAWLKEHHPCYTLLSNCLLPKRVIEAVRAYAPKRLYVSLDGTKDTYRQMRGCDGYDRVMEVLDALAGKVPISLMFCLSPWNSFQDMEHVINVAKKYGVDVRIGIYGTMDFFDTTADLLTVDMESYMEQIPANIHDTEENYDFVALYNEWRNGHLRLRCHSIYSELVIHSNGNVPICQNLNIILGNIHEQSLDDIFNARKSARLQCIYSRQCNNCWINFHRKYDIILLRNFEKLLPKRFIGWCYGKYQWSAYDKETYKQYFRRCSN